MRIDLGHAKNCRGQRYLKSESFFKWPKLIRFAFAFLCLHLILITSAISQNVQSEADSADLQREFRRLDIFPAISSSPETSLTLGVIGIKYFDLSGGDLSTPISNVEFFTIYTLNNQFVAETSWELFTRNNKWRLYGNAFYEQFPDRNYGLGNDATTLIEIAEGKGRADTLNYLEFDSDRIKFSPIVLRKIRPNLFFGLQYDMEYLYNDEAIPDQYRFISADSVAIKNMSIAGLRSGLGFQLLFDNRDLPLNPLKGHLISLNNINYGDFLGSDYDFTSLFIDARHYLNTHQNQTLALRTSASFRWTDDDIPMRALSRVGGHKFMRGYFKGTYQDHHMLAFEAEYRLPFWEEGTSAKLWQVWRRLGAVAFVSGAQVFPQASDLQLDKFNFALGGGLRILFNPDTRVNIRIDCAVGLSKNSDGINKRQSGFYFYLGEAF